MDASTLILVALTLLLDAVVAMPLARYVFVGWKAKRADIMGGQSAEARWEYFKMFVRGEVPHSAEEAFLKFDKFHTRWYGRRLYIAPFVLLLIVSSVVPILIMGAVLQHQGLAAVDQHLIALDLTGLSALIGAYMWVVNDFIWRARRLDLSPSDVHWGVLRLMIALPLGYAFASLVPDDGHKPFVAFALGAFPL